MIYNLLYDDRYVKLLFKLDFEKDNIRNTDYIDKFELNYVVSLKALVTRILSLGDYKAIKYSKTYLPFMPHEASAMTQVLVDWIVISG